MAVPVGTFTQVDEIIRLAIEQGCEQRETKATVVLPTGKRKIRYLYNPATEGTYDISDYESGESMAPSCIQAAERRLGVKLTD